MEYIKVFDLQCNFVKSVLDGIENGLFQTKEWKRKKLKIRICTGCFVKYSEVQDFMLNINWFESLDINHFMFIWEFSGVCQDDENMVLKDLKDMSCHIEVIRFDGDIF